MYLRPKLTICSVLQISDQNVIEKENPAAIGKKYENVWNNFATIKAPHIRP